MSRTISSAVKLWYVIDRATALALLGDRKASAGRAPQGRGYGLRLDVVAVSKWTRPSTTLRE